MLVAALGHHRHFVQPPGRRKAEAQHAGADLARHFAHLFQMRVHFGAGLMHRLERRAGKFELPARLQAERGAVLGQADDVARLPSPAASRSASCLPAAARMPGLPS